MLRLPTTLIAGPHRDRALNLLQMGRQIFESVGLFHQSSDGADVVLPPESPVVIFPDRATRKATGDRLQGTEEVHHLEWLDKSFRLQNQMDEFVRVCGV